MGYEKEVAKEELQTGFNWSQIPPLAYVITAGLGIAAFGIAANPGLIWAVLLGGAGLGAGWLLAEKKREAREAMARAAGFANVCGPVVIGSIHPLETVDELLERVAFFREQLRLSGNLYAEKIPVIAHPYRPMIYGPGQLTMAWNIYQRQVGETQHLENERWRNGQCPVELRAVFQSQVMNQIPETV